MQVTDFNSQNLQEDERKGGNFLRTLGRSAALRGGLRQSGIEFVCSPNPGFLPLRGIHPGLHSRRPSGLIRVMQAVRFVEVVQMQIPRCARDDKACGMEQSHISKRRKCGSLAALGMTILRGYLDSVTISEKSAIRRKTFSSRLRRARRLLLTLGSSTMTITFSKNVSTAGRMCPRVDSASR
jgi:hypothetical protein